MAQDPDGAHDPHEPPSPAITPLLPMAENSEIARRAFSNPHFGHAIGLSAADIARRVSNFASQSTHLYSYSGIVTKPRPA